MAREKTFTLKQKIIIYAGIKGGSGHCRPGGSGPGNIPAFTFLTDEQGNVLTSENGVLLMTENSED